MSSLDQLPKSRADVVSMLRDSGITPTHQRIKIGEVLFSCKQHLSAEQVLVAVNQEDEEVSKATVYNTLGVFAQHGLIREVIVDPSKVFYDSNLSKHHHLYYSDTGELEDLTDESVEISKLPELPNDLQIEDVDVIIRVHRN
ncbi:MAG: transcriptional repressor [Gammaproteobacteria bacterium]|nr:transcriptional repressor [Gammaproteobacteria bacterium]